MSAYSDWKYGALSDNEYRAAMAAEAARDRAIEEEEQEEFEDEEDDEWPPAPWDWKIWGL